MPREKVFRFKQFSVRNELSAMKVGTDGVLLGAWADTHNARKVLDIGTGTGLIALMIAQRTNADIQAVEIDADAVTEASLNFGESPWHNRLSVVHADFVEFAETCKEKFDVIVSNPPYFINSLVSPNEQRTKARHTGALSFEQLIRGAEKLLADNGHIYLITPSDSEQDIESIVGTVGLCVAEKLYVIPTMGATPKRILWNISVGSYECKSDELTIEIERHVYTDKYTELTRDYYINM